jgi:hypothetical protein
MEWNFAGRCELVPTLSSLSTVDWLIGDGGRWEWHGGLGVA